MKRKTATPKTDNSAHFAHSFKEKKQDIFEKRKKIFIELLSETGVVTDACKGSKIPRRTAYHYFKSDAEFAAAWGDAIETAHDRLRSRARRRAKEGKSNKLLIYLLNQNEREKRWRKLIIKTCRVALEAVHQSGENLGLSEDVIQRLQNAVAESFNNIRFFD